MKRRLTAMRCIAAIAFCSITTAALAWPLRLSDCLARDARRLLPRSLALVLAGREAAIRDQAQHLSPQLTQALAADLSRGELSAETIARIEEEANVVVRLLRERRVEEGLVRLGAFARIPADLSDPMATAGAITYPTSLASEYYAFIEGSLDKIPVVLDQPSVLRLDRAALGPFWRSLLERSRNQAPIIRTEMFQGGHVMSHELIDYRSPVFGVASLSYSRAVTGIAATWLALWHEAGGDLTRRPGTTLLRPSDPNASTASASPPAVPR